MPAIETDHPRSDLAYLMMSHRSSNPAAQTVEDRRGQCQSTPLGRQPLRNPRARQGSPRPCQASHAQESGSQSMPRRLGQGQAWLARPRCYDQLRGQSVKRHPNQYLTVERQRRKEMTCTQCSWLLTAVYRGSSYFEARNSKIPSVKECNNDNEGEEMDQQTPDSENTKNEDSDSSFGSEDDIWEIYEEHCEMRRSEYIDDMANLERQFVHLKEQLYLERANQKELKLEDVKLGLATEYLQPLEDLQNNISKRIKVTGVLKKMKLNKIKRKYEAEEIAACPYNESGRALLQDSIRCDFDEKIRLLEENHKSIDIK
ncbi:uncharacterized protein LOC142775085 [Rhipicephalus microplus]|uniref:uncharacterized protein LOC142775085 n=1 Tax=Rhipicephalus microplus TaxID=6941 RepID=UPI003F6D2B64